ncbi:MAG: hypothetical protein KDN18_04140 [Verrucomicrobiae bacterium]|nr:hypothetical protein [Verrucomicrobiae bacterium]
MTATPDLKHRKWPVILGSALIPFGLVGALMGWRVAATSGVVTEGWIQSAFFLLLIIGAITLIARAIVSRIILLIWAAAKIPWSYFYVSALSAEVASGSAESGAAASSGMVPVLFFGMLAWACLLPVFLLILFSLSPIRRQFARAGNG